ncbi:YfhO family protein [Ruminococcaceae bacterium OttesenSCG-928-N02]|nr:YfhO family protein [Ruminococcaceae bacterium OttesenSCG-928-N02]
MLVTKRNLPLLEQQRNKKYEYMQAFFIGLVVAMCIFLPFLIVDKGFFLYCGDYNSQQIPFYTYVHNAIRTGNINYSWETDLGTSFLNAYSYYMGTSPFMLLLLPFPSSWVPYLMAPLMAIKLATATFSSYGFLRRYAKGHGYALFGALLYAFSGYSIYNIFFNSGFLEAIALFPFTLWAMDHYFATNRRGPFALSLAINLFNNYFFFFGQAIFIAIYYFVRLLSGGYPRSLKKFYGFAFEAVIGSLMGFLPALPALLNMLDNPRVANGLSGFGYLLHGSVQQYMAIFYSAFFPPDPPYLPNLFTNGSIRWTSLSAYLPLVSFAGVATYLIAKKGKKDWLKNMLYVSFIMALVPVLNNAYYAFNVNYYARWFNMPILLMALASMRVVQNRVYQPRTGMRFTCIVMAIYLLFGLIPLERDDGTWQIGLAGNPAKYWLTFFTAVLGLLLFYLLLLSRDGKHPELFTRRLLSCTMVFILLFSIIHISLGKFPQWERDSSYKELTYDVSPAPTRLALGDDSFYRIDVYNSTDNLGLHWNIPCLQFFHSVVTPSIMEFYPAVGVTRNVRSNPPLSNYALRGLLSVKYLLVPTGQVEEMQATSSLQGYTYYTSLENYRVYENENYLPMGFVYDYYITQNQFDMVAASQAANLLMRGVLLSDEQIEEFAHLLTPLAGDQLTGLVYETYVQDANILRAKGVENFQADTNGFTCNITLGQESLVFFSVPYDQGFTAYVNDEEVQIESVSNGMSAIICPSGENNIRFEYLTYGLRTSMACVGVAFVIFAVYLCIPFIQKKRHMCQEDTK